jgi:hypothetical protein
VGLVAPGLDVLADVEVCAALAVVVDRLAVGEQRPPPRVEGGQCLKVRKYTRSAVRFSTFAGQAERLIRFLTPGTASATPRAPVGLGAAAGRPPKVAQVPMAMVAAALPQTSRAIWRALRPPIVQ